MVANLVVGIDGSGPSRAALTWALTLARTGPRRLTLVHVAGETARRGDLEWARQLSREALGETPIRELRLSGPVGSELAAAAGPTELLVIGTHKTGFLRGRVVGTLGIVVAATAAGPVAVIPEGVPARSGVVLGVGGDGWRSSVPIAVREAQRLDQPLILVHGAAEHRAPEHGDAAERGLAHGRALLEEAATLARAEGPLVVRRQVSGRRPADALLDASRGAALLVVGAPRTSVGFLGSVTHEVLLNINTAVLVAR